MGEIRGLICDEIIRWQNVISSEGFHVSNNNGHKMDEEISVGPMK